MNDDFLTSHLTNAAENADIPSGDVNAVMARATHRNQRTRRVRGTAGIAAALAGTLAAANLMSGGAPTQVTASAASNGDAEIDWRAVTPSSALGWASSTGGDGPLYAVSTAPGQADVNKQNPSRVVYRSTDGVDWTAASTLGNDLYVSNLATRDDRVYAVGTAPAASSSGHRSDLYAGWSDDGAKSFNRTKLDVDWSRIDAVTKGGGFAGTKVAVGDDGVVAVATLNAELDVPKVLPAGVSAPNGWAITDAGVDLLGAGDGTPCPDGMAEPKREKAYVDKDGARRTVAIEPANAEPEPTNVERHPVYCQPENADLEAVARGTVRSEMTAVSPQDAYGVTASYTWDQLGVTGDLERAVRRQPIGFFAAPNSTSFQRIDLPLDGNTGTLALTATPDGFELVATSSSRQPSTDGIYRSTATALRSADGKTWQRGNGSPGDVDWVTSIGVLNQRSAIIGQNASGIVLAQSDGNGGWTTTPLNGVIDAAVLDGGTAHVASAAIGPLGIVLVASVDPSEDDARAMKFAREEAEWRPTWRLLVSRDGSKWDDRNLESVAGREIMSIQHVLMTGPRAVVTMMAKGAPNKAGDPIALVGVPR